MSKEKSKKVYQKFKSRSESKHWTRRRLGECPLGSPALELVGLPAVQLPSSLALGCDVSTTWLKSDPWSSLGAMKGILLNGLNALPLAHTNPDKETVAKCLGFTMTRRRFRNRSRAQPKKLHKRLRNRMTEEPPSKTKGGTELPHPRSVLLELLVKSLQVHPEVVGVEELVLPDVLKLLPCAD